MRHSYPYCHHAVARLPFLYHAALVLGLSLGLAPGLLAQDTLKEKGEPDDTVSRMVVEVEEILGMTIADLTPDLARQFRIDASHQGVIVTAVEPRGPAALIQFAPGDLIEEVRVRGFGRAWRRSDYERISSVYEFIRAARLASKSEREILEIIDRRSGFTSRVFIPLSRGSFSTPRSHSFIPRAEESNLIGDLSDRKEGSTLVKFSSRPPWFRIQEDHCRFFFARTSYRGSSRSAARNLPRRRVAKDGACSPATSLSDRTSPQLRGGNRLGLSLSFASRLAWLWSQAALSGVRRATR